jgi:type I site-specific restriction endonuclease
MDEFDQSFQKAFKETLLPVIERLDRAVEALKNEKSSSNENLINTTIDALKSTMVEMMNDFKDNLSGSAKTEIENMLKILAGSAQVLTNLPDQLGKIESTIVTASEKFREVSTLSLENNKAAEDARNRQRSQANEETNKALAQSIEVVKAAEDFVRNFADEATKMSSSISRYQFLIESLNETGKNLNLSSVKINEAVGLIGDYNQKSVDSNRILTESFEKQLQQITSMNQEHIQNYNTIKESLNEVFEGIDRGLTGYRDHTSESINKYLSEFSDKLSKASAALSGSISELHEGLEGLNDFLGKIKR